MAKSLPSPISRPDLGLVVVLLLVPFPVIGQAPSDARTEADRAFASHEPLRARDLYRAAAEESQGSQRASARLRQAHLEWRFLSRPEEARQILRAAVGEGHDVPGLLLELAELERAEERWAEAREAAVRALLLAVGEGDRDEARVA